MILTTHYFLCNIEDCYFLIADNQEIVEVNSAFLKFFNLTENSRCNVFNLNFSENFLLTYHNFLKSSDTKFEFQTIKDHGDIFSFSFQKIEKDERLYVTVFSKKIIKSNHNDKSFIELIDLPCWICSPDLKKIIQVNEAFVQFYKIGRSEILTDSTAIFDIMNQELSNQLKLLKLSRQKISIQIQHKRRHDSQNNEYVNSVFNPLLTETGALHAYLVFSFDISEDKKYLSKILYYNKMQDLLLRTT